MTAKHLLLSFCLVIFTMQPAFGDELQSLMDKIRVVNDPDTARFFSNTERALSLAEGNDSIIVDCLCNQLIYETTHGMMERAQQSLERLRNIYEDTHQFNVDFFNSWKNLAQAYYNNNSIMLSMSEIRKMQTYAQKNKDNYGLGCVFLCFGTFYANSYTTSMENLKKAHAYMQKANAMDGNYVIYYTFAFTADLNGKYEEMLSYVEKMVEARPQSTYVQQIADYMRLSAYVETGERTKAAECYKRLKKLWDDYEVYGNLESNTVHSMTQYLCKFGNPDLVPAILRFISEDYQDLRLDSEVMYYSAKGNYKVALEKMMKLKEVEEKIRAEQQAAEMASANAYLNNQQLEDEKQQILLDNAEQRNILLYVIVFSLIIIGTAAVYIALSTRRYNKILKIERDNVEEERKKAVYLSEMKTAFINNMSHEVRTPLNSIVGFNDLLNNPDFDFSEEERREMLDGIHQQTEGLMDLLNNVIYLSRLDGHDIIPQQEDVRLADICTRSYEKVADDIKPDVPVLIQDAQSSDMLLHTDKHLLGSALTCVLDNAIKFTNSGEIKVEIAVSAESAYPTTNSKRHRNNSFVRIIVTDTGEGIPADKAELVFERFEKLGRMEAGFGLGLSIARENLALIGGTIHLDTTYTSGTRMIIELPR